MRCFCLVMATMLFPLTVAAQTGAAWLARGDSLRAAEAYAAAEAAYENARAQTPVAADLRLGDLFFDRERWGDAADRFDAVLRADPDNLAAHLGRGRAHRERGRFSTPLRLAQEILDWRDAERHFAWVLARDSAFADVLLAYAVLEQYRGRHEAAMAKGEAQVRLRPDLPAAHLGLARLFRVFFAKDPEGAQAWLAGRTEATAAYFAAEALRLDGQTDAAEAAFVALLARPTALPRTPVLLSMARLYAAKGALRRAEAYARRALDESVTPVEAAFVLADTMPILTDEERRTAHRLEAPDAFRAFFAGVWDRRDPLPASADNPRLAEHFRRLAHAEAAFAFFGFRERWNHPDPRERLALPEGYRQAHFFNDKGLVYLRHGPPDDRIATLGADAAANESWRYAATEDRPALVFHFASLGGANWRLVPVLLGREMLGDRVHWGPPFMEGYALYREAPDRRALSLLAFTETMREASQASVDVGLTTDRHTWPEGTRLLDLPVSMAAFRGAAGQTDLHVFYAFPTAALAKNNRSGRVDIEIGLRVWNETSEAARQVDARRLALTADPTGGIIDGFRLAAAPDAYRVAVHVRPQRGPQIGTFATARRLPDFRGDTLMMSDLVVARTVRAHDPARDGEAFVRGDRAFLPNPTGRFATGQPVHVLFEAYHLTPAADGQTAYTLAFTLAPETPRRRGFLRRRSDRPTLSLRTAHTGRAATVRETAELDVRSVEPGAYVLTVTLADTIAGREARQSVTVWLE